MKDPYVWTKDRISYLIKNIISIKNDNLDKSTGKLWSIKKILAIDYYIAATHNIYKKNFKEWFYIDTHCGEGLIFFEDHELLKNEKFPGTPLIAFLRKSKNPFTAYFLSDLSKNAINTLNYRMCKLRNDKNEEHIMAEVRSFSDTVDAIIKIQKWGRMYLIIIDPKSISDIHWSQFVKLLKINKADIFLTFMTYAYGLSLPHAKAGKNHAKNFDKVFGNSEWKKCNTAEELLNLYMGQIREHKSYVNTIPINKAGDQKIYDLIFITGNSTGAGAIMDYTNKIMKHVNTDLIERALKVSTQKDTDLDSFI